MATANPALNDAIYDRINPHLSGIRPTAMTVSGAVLKTAVLVVILSVTAGYAWIRTRHGQTGPDYGLLIAGSLGGLVTALATIFFPKISPFTAPVYAAFEGLVLGTISTIYEARYPGIAFQALALSVGTLTAMLFLYGTGLVRATEKFKTGVFAATAAIAIVYLIGFIASFFGAGIPYIHESGLIGIGFSLVVVVIAALNLIIDFDFIEQGVRRAAPKYMEWYAGFGLLVTLVWMYLEILRLLAKLRGRD